MPAALRSCLYSSCQASVSMWNSTMQCHCCCSHTGHSHTRSDSKSASNERGRQAPLGFFSRAVAGGSGLHAALRQRRARCSPTQRGSVSGRADCRAACSPASAVPRQQRRVAHVPWSRVPARRCGCMQRSCGKCRAGKFSVLTRTYPAHAGAPSCTRNCVLAFAQS